MPTQAVPAKHPASASGYGDTDSKRVGVWRPPIIRNEHTALKIELPRIARTALLTAGIAATALHAPPATSSAAPLNEQIALINESGRQADGESELNGTAQVTSHNGQFAVFSTGAGLVPWDTNGVDDIYLRDTADGITILVSSVRGTPGNDHSLEPTISADGRYVAFTTWATNLKKDANGSTLDVLVKDMYTDRLRRVSVKSNGSQVGRNSFSPVISGNGRFVSFQTFGKLGAKDDDVAEDVYVRDLVAGKTKQVSLLPGTSKDVKGSVLNGDISDDGNLITFGNDNRLWVRNISRGTTIRFHREPDMPPCQPFPAGSAGRPTISGNGRFVAFASCATHLPGEDHTSTDVYRLELNGGKITRVTAGIGHSYLPSLSRSGRYVGFGSDADNVVRGDVGMSDAFVADLKTQTITRASQRPDGIGGNNRSASSFVAISGDGHTLAYVTYADNLVDGDMYDWPEALLWRR
ncbi:TolB family protein [Nocardioides astragali]|uniref:TolB family protein n=1 Tax=Nocardioides astragali TaxID=1776736 RepID=A0ABW2N7Z2_9ACTN|nr:hypothetical protein [Nocardioides astragali]